MNRQLPADGAEPDRAAAYEQARRAALTEQTDQDLIVGHPYQPSEWGDVCGQEVNGWPCGFSLSEHADPGHEGDAAGLGRKLDRGDRT